MAEITNSELAKVRGAVWTSLRYFAVDYDNGSDSNVGFSDVSAAAAGTVAKKTWEGLQVILPASGSGKSAEIVVRARAAGATYRNVADTADAVLDLVSYSGYSRLSVRGTDTVTTASATAFLDDVNDQICQGGRIAAGTNTAGYRITRETASTVGATNANPVVVEHDGVLTYATGERVTIIGGADAHGFGNYLGAPHGWVVTVVDSTHFSLVGSDGTTFADMSTVVASITRYKVVKADGSAAALPVDPAAVMWRLRGDIANVTVATRNMVLSILANTTDTFVFNTPTALAVVDPTNDFWYIEDAGVAFASISSSGDSTVHVSGIRFTGPASLSNNKVSAFISFCQMSTMTGSSIGSLTTRNTWVNSASVSRIVGPNKASGASSFTTLSTISLSMTHFSSSLTFTECISYRLADSVMGNASSVTCTVNRSGAAATAVSSNGLINFERVRFKFGRFTANNSHASIQQMQFEGAPTQQLFFIIGTGLNWTLERIYDQRTTVSGRFGIVTNGVINSFCFSSPTVFIRGDDPGNLVGDYAEIVINEAAGIRCNDVFYGSIIDCSHNRVIDGNVGFINEKTTLALGNQFINDSGADILRFQIVKPTGDRRVAMAQADTVANASGELMLSTVNSFGTLGEFFMFCHGEGLSWVVSDDTPTIGDIIYLSTDNPGNAQAAVPVMTGTNQKRRLGNAAAVTTNGALTYVLIRWQPEKLPVPADNLP